MSSSSRSLAAVTAMLATPKSDSLRGWVDRLHSGVPLSDPETTALARLLETLTRMLEAPASLALRVTDVTALNKHLKEFLRSDEAYFRYLPVETWMSGGCWLLAEALRRVLSGELVAVISDNGVEHVALLVDDWVVDGDGFSRRPTVLRRWQTAESVPNPRIVPFVDVRDEVLAVGEIPAPDVRLGPLVRDLAHLVQASNQRTKPAAVDVVLDVVRDAAQREPPGSLLSIREVRQAAKLQGISAKGAFDKAMLKLADGEKIQLHHHDYPMGLVATDRAQLVHDAANDLYYVGVAFKTTPATKGDT